MLYVVDIDQCISDGRRRALAAGPEPDRVKDLARYERWKNVINSGIEHDESVPGMQSLVSALAGADADVVYMTARGESLYQETRDWLRQHNFPDVKLIMRAEDDFRPSAQYKESAINKLLAAEHEPVIVFDDDERGELAKVCRRRGWTMLKAISCEVTHA